MGATYIGGDGYSAPVIWRSEQTTTTVQDYYFLHRDYLGSILGITDRNGTFKEKRHFDAWGNLTKFSNDTGVTTPPSGAGGLFLDRGYTGHEHLLSVGLVHMNGRLYDPVLHRFLMPDNFVQDLYNTQNFNRYSYVLNNPLKYTDPSGEIIPLLIIGAAALVGAYAGGAIANGTWNPLKWDWGSGRTWVGVLGGAVIGAASAGIGIAVSMAVQPVLAGFGITGGVLGGAITGALSGFASGAFSGGFMTLLPGGGGKFWNGVKQGALMGGLGGAVIGGIIGGFSAPKGHLLKGAPLRPSVSAVQTMEAQGVNLADDSMAIKAELMSPQNTVAPTTAPTGPGQTAGATIRDGGLSGNLNIKATVDPFSDGLSSFTQGNFRSNLSKLTGFTPTDSHAHHVFPQEFASEFAKTGINVHNPQYGAWWQSTSHLQNAASYNTSWRNFLLTNPSNSEILNFGRTIMANHGIPVGF